MIIYFSGNGNTRWCAETIAQATNDKALSIANAGYDIQIAPNEPLGIFFPVHGWKPPRIILDYIDKMSISTPPSYCYSVCTCGDSIGDTMNILKQALSAKGIHLNCVFSIIMPETYVCLPFMYTDTLANEQRKIKDAYNKMKEIATIVNKREERHVDLVKGPLPWFFTHIVGSFFNRHMITDKPFRVDHSLCTHCGRCAKVCPVENIVFDKHEATPKWKKQKQCTCCMACYHHCPTHAINYGKITRHRGQYFFEMHIHNLQSL